ncbi:hypothetical protein ACFQV2_36585 [Actinokineospora soli]|uniref:Uncharacterized protein n=1 Tax=Actinokineospora soli TaxID=1048753 RepID=A0ABW2TX84_9PSEU
MSRALVLVAAAAVLAASGLVSFVVLLLGPAVPGRPVAGVVVFTLVIALSGAAAVVLAVRGRPAVWGCSTLLVGAAVAALLLAALLYQR